MGPKVTNKTMKAKTKKRVAQDMEVDDNASESDLDGHDMLEMMEEDDLNYVKQAITSRSFHIFNKIRYNRTTQPDPKKVRLAPKREQTQLEEDYEETGDQQPKNVVVKRLLPIKTKQGIVHQNIVDDAESNNVEEEVPEEQPEEEEFTYVEDKFDLSKPISATELFAERNSILRDKKIYIGTLCSGVLENPEEKVTNIRTLLKLMDEEIPEVYYSVKKIVTVSLLEVFKDVLPTYEIKKTTPGEGVKLKKDTLKLQKYEESLVLYYKRYLQKLEKMCSVLSHTNKGKVSPENLKLGSLAVGAMCELLMTHPYFNYAENIAQAIVPFLNNNRDKNLREQVRDSLKTVFKQDKKEEITVVILRLCNKYIKSHLQTINHPEMFQTFLGLNLKDANLIQEQETTVKLKHKKLMSRKQNVLQNVSKKERKRKKKLQALETELLETQAEENRNAKRRNIAEMAKLVFGIYFRILKQSNKGPILGVALEGLATHAHCINLEFYMDLVNVLDKLLRENWLGYRQQLHCIQTVFAILGGQGEALNVDPTRFYVHLYSGLLNSNAASRSHGDFRVVLTTLQEALIKRRKKITTSRMLGYVKRLTTVALQLLHNGSIGSLALVRTVMQLDRSSDILLDLDCASYGHGRFNPEVDDPEYSNAASSALYELELLQRHYHPVVAKYAKSIATGSNLDPTFVKCSPEELFLDFDMAQMAFNPAVPVPKMSSLKTREQRHLFVDKAFEGYCRGAVRQQIRNTGFLVDE